jgi:hypothetical protein
VFQRGHVTSLIRVGGAPCEGDGCGGEGEGDGGYIRGCGVVPGWWGEVLDDVVAGGRECAHVVVVGPRSCSPALVRTRRRSFVLVSVLLLVPVCPRLFIRARLCWVGPRSYSLPLVCARFRSFAGLRLSLLICPRSVVLAGPRARSYPSSLVRTRLHSFAGPRLSPPVCVRSVVLVPARLWLSPLPVALVWLSFVLVCARLCLSFVSLSNIRLVHT